MVRSRLDEATRAEGKLRFRIHHGDLGVVLRVFFESSPCSRVHSSERPDSLYPGTPQWWFAVLGGMR